MINPGRPTYLETSFSTEDIQNGVPLPKLPLKGKTPPAADTTPIPQPPADPDPIQEFRAQMRGAPPPNRPVEERAIPPESDEALLSLIAKVLRVAAARIRYHEAQAQRLRAALALAAPSEAAAPAAPDSKSAIDLLVELAKSLPDVPEASQ